MVAPLFLWGQVNGVRCNAQIEFKGYGGGNWGVALPEQSSLEAGTVLLTIPNGLVWQAASIQRELDRDHGRKSLEDSLQFLQHHGYSSSQAEFLLFVKVLKENTCSESRWRPWLDSLPRLFGTAVYLTSAEIMCLPTLTCALAERECLKFKSFMHAAKILDTTMALVSEDVFRWAFSVVYSRCYAFPSDSLDTDETQNAQKLERTCMVPFGDLFNHRVPANVFTAKSADCVNLIFKGLDKTENTDSGDDGQLYLSYGEDSNPHRFLVVFGFVNESMTECFIEMVFSRPCERHITLGCEDSDRMVFRVCDGAVSNTVRDSILFALLDSLSLAEQNVFYEAHERNDVKTKRFLHAKYHAQVDAVISAHAVRVANELEMLCEKARAVQRGYPDSNPNIGLILQHNQFLCNAFRRVAHRIVGANV